MLFYIAPMCEYDMHIFGRYMYVPEDICSICAIVKSKWYPTKKYQQGINIGMELIPIWPKKIGGILHVWGAYNLFVETRHVNLASPERAPRRN